MDTTPTIYLRRCDITGEGMNSGWVFSNGSFYIKHDCDVLAELRRDRAYILHDIEDVDIDMVQDPMRFAEFEQARGRALANKDTDEDLRILAYQTDYGYYTEWEECLLEDGDTYYDADGNEYTHKA
jgi:hypothetical protein